MLADMPAERNELDEARRVLRAAADAGDSGAPSRLAIFLTRCHLPPLPPPHGLIPDSPQP